MPLHDTLDSRITNLQGELGLGTMFVYTVVIFIIIILLFKIGSYCNTEANYLM